MLPKLQYFSIFLYQKAFWYLPTGLIDWDPKAGLLVVSMKPKWVSKVSFAISVTSMLLFIISTGIAAAQLIFIEKYFSISTIIAFLGMSLLSLFSTLILTCFALLSSDINCLKDLNQLFFANQKLLKCSIGGKLPFQKYFLVNGSVIIVKIKSKASLVLEPLKKLLVVFSRTVPKSI